MPIRWRFECDIPGALDYAPIFAPDKKVIQRAIELVDNDVG
jgi:hypothetical protein